MAKPLSIQQRDVILAMIQHAPAFDGSGVSDAERQQWAATVKRLSYGAPCECGMCPTFEIYADGAPVPESIRRRVLSAEGPASMVLLFIDDGVPSYLEVASVYDVAAQLPTPEQLVFNS